mmetsp:Transcript_46068/g.73111  ORF Transcript_46068/g.73111 Transcript_46068/m.73111 type:complete len:200 (+) Transcript_46068:733-1332(+)
MAPEDPIRAPTMVNKLLESTKPSAAKAQPDALFSRVMATGMSAPPTWEVTTSPSPAAAAVPQSSVETLSTPSSEGSRKAQRPAAQAAAKEPESTLPPGSAALPPTRPCNLAKATTDPVTVSAPMPEARYSEVACMASAAPGCRAEATAVNEAARPTREWKAATSCGSEVISTCEATAMPRPVPAASTVAICVSTAVVAP